MNTRGSRILGGLLATAIAVIGPGCTYLGTVVKQTAYALRQQGTPEQKVYKHMLSRDTFYVFGTLQMTGQETGDSMAVAAVSDRFTAGEVVDVNHVPRADSYYGLNLPDGSYRLLVLADRNHDGFYDGTEVIGSCAVSLNSDESPDRVRSGVDIPINPERAVAATNGPLLPIAVQPATRREESLFYPKGTIRSLDDPIFSPAMAQLGMYEPAAFLERAPMMFYALEENNYKIPVVFVHGIGGSARDFQEIIAHLDRSVYQPWFFHYASGSDLKQLSEMFYRLFLSGKVIPLDQMPLIIVAHSMGGLVVRDALNRQTGKSGENTVRCLITIASPLGGHPAAGNANKAPVVIPSWRDLDPGSTFVQRLHRRPLPAGLAYHLFYTYGDDRTFRTGEPGDGVVPLSSQLAVAAQNEAKDQFGFNASHTGVLGDPELIARLTQALAAVQSPFPDDHLAELRRGGYPLTLGPEFTTREAYYVHTLGYYADALLAGRLKPIHPAQVHFIQAVRGEKSPSNDAETAWRKLARYFPQRDGRVATNLADTR